MTSFAHVCRTCGRTFEFPGNLAMCPCPGCGTQHARPENAEEGKGRKWLSRANEERAACDYEHAEEDYRRALGENPEDHEALWGLVLCKYGVEFVRDPYTKALLPTLHFLYRTPITEDDDYLQACRYAPEEIREQYQREAAYIEQVQSQLIAPDGQPAVDIFLCYKATRADGKTEALEMRHARELYYALQDMGYSVFFAHDTLQKIAAGANYEAKIFHALFSAKVMLVVCSDPANLETAWVRSEWRRFMERCDKNEPCRIFPLFFDNFEPYDLPVEFRRRGIQGIQMGAINALDNLRSNLQNVIQKQPARRAAVYAEDETEAEVLETLLLPIEYELSRGSWKNVADRCGDLIMKYPTCAKLYLYRLLATVKVKNQDALRTTEAAFETGTDWEWAMRYAAPQEKAEWSAILRDSQELRRKKDEERRIAEQERKEEQERRAEQRRQEEAEKKQRLAEEERQENEIYEKCCQLLQKKKWAEADAAAERLTKEINRLTIQFLAKEKYTSEAELVNANPYLFNDTLWRRVQYLATPERREAMKLIEAEAEKRADSQAKKGEISRFVLTIVFSALGLFAATYGTVLLQKWLPQFSNGLYYVSVMACYAVFACFYNKYEGEKGMLIFCGILVALVGVAFAALNLDFLAPVAVVIAGAAMIYAAKESMESVLYGLMLPAIWMILYSGSYFLDALMEGNFLHDALMAIHSACRTWGAIVAAVLPLVVIVKTIGDDEGIW